MWLQNSPTKVDLATEAFYQEGNLVYKTEQVTKTRCKYCVAEFRLRHFDRD